MQNVPQDGKILLEEAALRADIDFVKLIAQTSLWADPEVYRRLVAESGSGTWFPNTRRKKKNEKRGEVIDGVLLDDNSKANEAIKVALGYRHLRNYATCHVWPATCYDPRYHTNIANLVLLPRPIAGFSDHDETVEMVLQYRAFELYGWCPAEKPVPIKPTNYPGCWLLPVCMTPEVERSLSSRRGAKKADYSTSTKPFDRAAGFMQSYPPRAEAHISSTLSPEVYNTMISRIRRWALNPSSNVHIIIGLMVRAPGGMEKTSLIDLTGKSTRSIRPSGAIASLMTCAGNAYGLVFIADGSLIKIHPDLLPEIRRHNWR